MQALRGDSQQPTHANLTQVQIQALYQKHRTNRNAQQRAKLLAPAFPGVTVDEILAKLEDPTLEPGFKDWRHCLVFWARPPTAVRALISEVQQQLRSVAPSKSSLAAVLYVLLRICADAADDQIFGRCHH